jgi:hypothetical protein
MPDADADDATSPTAAPMVQIAAMMMMLVAAMMVLS